MDVFNIIKIYRKFLGLTQEEVASKAGINDKYYGRIERGESCPTIDYVIKICEAMDISLLELMLLEIDVSSEKKFVRNPKITSAIIQGLKQEVDIHFNREVAFEGCESCIWYSGYVGSLNFDEFEMKVYAVGNIKGTLFIEFKEILILNSKNVSNELRKYIKNDSELKKIIEYMPYDEEILNSKQGNAFFVTETNWFTAKLINNQTGEIMNDGIVLDSDNIIDNFSGPELFFDCIFGDTGQESEIE